MHSWNPRKIHICTVDIHFIIHSAMKSDKGRQVRALFDKTSWVSCISLRYRIPPHIQYALNGKIAVACIAIYIHRP